MPLVAKTSGILPVGPFRSGNPVAEIAALQTEHAVDELILQYFAEAFLQRDADMIDTAGRYNHRGTAYDPGQHRQLIEDRQSGDSKIDPAVRCDWLHGYKAQAATTDIDGY